ncbi:cytochrome P450 CYP82D47 [Arachis ipaensis]|uniref:Cytochrome P450 n=1 Tax=Arachis hypogaea TaxID=3818 RepID=A0A445CBP7_ARAHY|nr:cytochrome P450 CYP82D47 [Arachis ipaensis]XP_025668189.1 cytochrome P450 CYP82D47 [Arachis hypogaea]QHN93508.1 Cytochrome P450 [Arachis hypogaea]RYR48339.1 hypothetical protein Ahy_A07g034363 [Arachis hypogaea]
MDFENLLSQPAIFTMALLFFSLFALSFQSKRHIHKAGARKAPPEAGGAWPLIGHLHLLGGQQPPHVTLGNMADKYGPIFTIRIGRKNLLVVSNSEIAKECFTVNDKAFAGRPKMIAYEILGYDYAIFSFKSYGPSWRNLRKMAILEVLSGHKIHMNSHVMLSEVKTAMNDSYNNSNNKSMAVTEMDKWFGEISLNVMFRLVVGKRFTGHSEENERIRKALRDFFDLGASFVVADSIPWLRWLDLDGGEKAMKKTAKELDEFVQNWLEEHRLSRNHGAERDYMDKLISSFDQGFGGHDVDTLIKAACLTLILGGTDTTTGTLGWALALLLNNRQVLNKAVHELDRHIGTNRMVIETDLNSLVYLQAIVKETFRLYPPAVLSLPHESMDDCVVGGYHIPAGTQLWTNISKMQRDPALYPDPLEFRPERFLTTHKDIELKGQHFELIPFGAGRRMCPGMSFGLQMVQLTLANVLHGFDIATADGKPVDMVEHAGITNVKANPLKVILTPRLSTQAYV